MLLKRLLPLAALLFVIPAFAQQDVSVGIRLDNLAIRMDGNVAGTGSGVTSVTNADGSLIFSPTTGDVVGRVSTTHSFNMTGGWTFTNNGGINVLNATNGGGFQFVPGAAGTVLSLTWPNTDATVAGMTLQSDHAGNLSFNYPAFDGTHTFSSAFLGTQFFASQVIGAVSSTDASAGTISVRGGTPAAAAASQAGLAATFGGGDAIAGTVTAGAAAGGAATIRGGDAKQKTSGNANGGDITLIPGAAVGTGVPGAVKYTAHLVTIDTGATAVSCTGLGTGGTAALDTGSSDEAGTITMTTGTTSGSSGVCTLTFATAYGANKPVVIPALVFGASDWGNTSIVLLRTESATAPEIGWYSSVAGTLTALTDASTYKIGYIVMGK